MEISTQISALRMMDSQGEPSAKDSLVSEIKQQQLSYLRGFSAVS